MTKQEKKARDKAYREAHKDECAARAAAYYKAHKDECAARIAAYYVAHKAEIVARAAVYYEAHKDESAAYREKNKDRITAREAAWAKANPDKVRDKSARRRAKKRRAFVEPVSRAVVFDRDNGICHLCGKKVAPKHWHLDHIVPLSQGGEHSYRNVAVSHPRCNLRKNKKIRGQFRLF